MKLSEVLQTIRLIKSGSNHGTRYHKHHPATVRTYVDMIPAGMGHQSPYGHLLLHPHYGHRGAISGLASVPHGLRFGSAGTSGSGVYHSSPGYHHHSTGYGAHMGIPGGGHPAPAGYDYHTGTGDSIGPIHTSSPSSSTGKSKSAGSSTITALTLLSFLFFLNILQNCLKEHMDTMNPTVMVMTAGASRTRVSKLAEMNSREQQHPISQSQPQPVLTMNRGDSVESQAPFSGGYTKIEYSNGNGNSNQRPDPEPEYYSPYANRTLTLVDNNYQERHPYQRHSQRLHGSYSSPLAASASTSSVSSSSSAANSGSNNYYPDAMDPYYMRIN